MCNSIKQFLNHTKDNNYVFSEIIKRFPKEFKMNIEKNINLHIGNINHKWNEMNTNMLQINQTLDNAVYGHKTTSVHGPW